MEMNHDQAIEALNEFLLKNPNLKYKRALDVGCGGGLLTIDLLSKYYKAIDMFDKCPDEVFTA